MSINVNVGGNTDPLVRDVTAAIDRINRSGRLKIRIDDKGVTQPLGNMKRSADEFTKSLEASNARVLAFGASVGVINAVAGAFKGLVTATMEVQKNLTDINVVMGLSNQQLDKFGGGLMKVAAETGAGFKAASDAATEFARQGLSVNETLKRTKDALILTRLTGMKAADSVKSLTAALNTFKGEIADSTALVSKFAAVDVKFAVSAEDFAQAISRAGQSARSAGVDLNQLIGLVTAAQERTARGGAVIGNAFKTIFTRVRRSSTLSELENLGIAVRDLQGKTLPAMKIMQSLANTYDTLTDAQRAYISQNVAGVFQINILKAAMADLGKANSVTAQATAIAAGATDESNRKNEQLRQTMTALATETGVAIQELAKKIGDIALAPGISKVLDGIKGMADSVGGILGDGEQEGNKFATGLLRGVGNILTGPGLVMFAAVAGKLFVNAVKYAQQSLGSLLNINKSANARRNIETSLMQVLTTNMGLQKEMLRTDISREQKERTILQLIQQQTQEASRLAALTKSMAPVMMKAGIGAGLSAAPSRTTTASGFVPNYSAADEERSEARKGGYAPGAVRTMKMPGVGSVVYNTAEKVKKFPGMTQPAIMPPSGKAKDNYSKSFYGAHGFDPYAAGGHVPNFADDGWPREIMVGAGKKRAYKKFGSQEALARSGLVPKTHSALKGYVQKSSAVTVPRGVVDRRAFESMLIPEVKAASEPWPRALMATVSERSKIAKRFGLDTDDPLVRSKVKFNVFSMQRGGVNEVEEMGDKYGGIDKILRGPLTDGAVKYANRIQIAGIKKQANSASIESKIFKTKKDTTGASGALGALYGTIFEAALSDRLDTKGSSVDTPGGDFDVRRVGKNVRALFGDGVAGKADYKSSDSSGNRESMAAKIVKELISTTPDVMRRGKTRGALRAWTADATRSYAKMEKQAGGLLSGPDVNAGGLIPNFASKFSTRAYTRGEGMRHTDALIKEPSDPNFTGNMKSYMEYHKEGPSTRHIDYMKSYNKGDAFDLFGAASRQKFMKGGGAYTSDKIKQQRSYKQGSSSNWEDLLYAFPQMKYRMQNGMTTSGTITAHMKNRLLNQNFKTIAGLPPVINGLDREEFRETLGNIGAFNGTPGMHKVEITDLYTRLKKDGRGDGKAYGKKAGGFIPNYADPLSDAIGRERSAGVPVSQIRVGTHNKLVGKSNPAGLGVTNTKDEPNGLRDVLGATGIVPNYSLTEKMGQFVGTQKSIDNLANEADEAASELAKLKDEISIGEDSVSTWNETVKEETKTRDKLQAEHDKMPKNWTNKKKAKQKEIDSSNGRLLQAQDAQFGATLRNNSQKDELTAAEKKNADANRKSAKAQARQQRRGMMGMGAMMGAQMAVGQMQGMEGFETSRAMQGTAGAVGMASTGASMGMMFGPVGTAIGAIGGGIYGLLDGFAKAKAAAEKLAEAHTKAGVAAGSAKFMDDFTPELLKTINQELAKRGKVDVSGISGRVHDDSNFRSWGLGQANPFDTSDSVFKGEKLIDSVKFLSKAGSLMRTDKQKEELLKKIDEYQRTNVVTGNLMGGGTRKAVEDEHGAARGWIPGMRETLEPTRANLHMLSKIGHGREIGERSRHRLGVDRLKGADTSQMYHFGRGTPAGLREETGTSLRPLTTEQLSTAESGDLWNSGAETATRFNPEKAQLGDNPIANRLELMNDKDLAVFQQDMSAITRDFGHLPAKWQEQIHKATLKSYKVRDLFGTTEYRGMDEGELKEYGVKYGTSQALRPKSLENGEVASFSSAMAGILQSSIRAEGLKDKTASASIEYLNAMDADKLIFGQIQAALESAPGVGLTGIKVPDLPDKANFEEGVEDGDYKKQMKGWEEEMKDLKQVPMTPKEFVTNWRKLMDAGRDDLAGTQMQDFVKKLNETRRASNIALEDLIFNYNTTLVKARQVFESKILISDSKFKSSLTASAASDIKAYVGNITAVGSAAVDKVASERKLTESFQQKRLGMDQTFKTKHVMKFIEQLDPETMQGAFFENDADAQKDLAGIRDYGKKQGGPGWSESADVQNATRRKMTSDFIKKNQDKWVGMSGDDLLGKIRELQKQPNNGGMNKPQILAMEQMLDSRRQSLALMSDEERRAERLLELENKRKREAAALLGIREKLGAIERIRSLKTQTRDIGLQMANKQAQHDIDIRGLGTTSWGGQQAIAKEKRKQQQGFNIQGVNNERAEAAYRTMSTHETYKGLEKFIDRNKMRAADTDQARKAEVEAAVTRMYKDQETRRTTTTQDITKQSKFVSHLAAKVGLGGVSPETLRKEHSTPEARAHKWKDAGKTDPQIETLEKSYQTWTSISDKQREAVANLETMKAVQSRLQDPELFALLTEELAKQNEKYDGQVSSIKQGNKFLDERFEREKEMRQGPDAFNYGMSKTMGTIETRVKDFRHTMGTQIPEMFSNGMSSAMMNAIRNGGKLKDVLRDAALGFLDTFNQKMMENFADQATMALFGSGTQRKRKGFAKGGLVGFNNGGSSGGGAAMVSNQEYRMSPEAVGKYGVGMMDAVNSGHFQRRSGGSSGGEGGGSGGGGGGGGPSWSAGLGAIAGGFLASKLFGKKEEEKHVAREKDRFETDGAWKRQNMSAHYMQNNERVQTHVGELRMKDQENTQKFIEKAEKKAQMGRQLFTAVASLGAQKLGAHLESSGAFGKADLAMGLGKDVQLSDGTLARMSPDGEMFKMSATEGSKLNANFMGTNEQLFGGGKGMFEQSSGLLGKKDHGYLGRAQIEKYAESQGGGSSWFHGKGRIADGGDADFNFSTSDKNYKGKGPGKFSKMMSRVGEHGATPYKEGEAGYPMQQLMANPLKALWKGTTNLFKFMNVMKKADGGKIVGQSGIDQIPAMLSEGEYVIRADAARKMGVPALDKINSGRFNKGGIVTNATSDPGSDLGGGASTNNVTITVNVDKSGGESKGDDKKSGDGEKDKMDKFSARIKDQVITVIKEETRPGGLLDDGK
jgi:TP901 family phage tail tape measure protein